MVRASDVMMGPHLDPAAARAALGGRAIGPHIPMEDGLRAALERTRAVGATAIQVWADNPKAWRRRNDPPAGLDAFRAGLADLGVTPVAIHAPYLVNLATPDPAVWDRSVETLTAELRMGVHWGAALLNTHIGSHRGAGVVAGVQRAGEALARILDAVTPGPDVPRLVLEVSAGQGDAIGASLVELGAILDAAAHHGADPDRLGVCLDTAHLWGAGFPLDEPGGLAGVLAELQREVGLERLAMLHLNDSRVGRGTRTDRHEHIGAGRIGPGFFRDALTEPRLAGVPAYLETPGMDSGWDAVNMDRVRRLIAGRPLPTLPPQAFDVRRDRA
jgi:deoxyribonuclease-4